MAGQRIETAAGISEAEFAARRDRLLEDVRREGLSG